MTDASVEVRNPSTSAERLAQIAAERPDLAPWILQHPNCYDGLREWVRSYALPIAQASAPQIATDAASMAAQTVPYVPGASPGLHVDPFAGPGQGNNATAGKSPSARRRNRLILGLSIAGVAALVLAGGGVWWFAASLTRGADSPESAISTLLSGVQHADPLAVARSLAPSEVHLLAEPLTRLAGSGSSETAIDFAGFLSAVRDSVSLDAQQITLDTEPIADGVVRVLWTDGTLRLDGDEDALTHAVMDAYAPILRAQTQSLGYSESETESIIEDTTTAMSEDLELTHTWEAAEAAEWTGVDAISLVAVDEGTGWYVSPLLSYLDHLFRNGVHAGYADANDLGDEVVAAKVFSAPEDAAEGLLDALASGRTDRIAEALPLAERRALSIYGDHSLDLEYLADRYSPDVEEALFSSVIEGDRARLSIDGLTVSFTEESGDGSSVLYDRWEVNGTCADWTDQFETSSYSSWYDEFTYYVDEQRGSVCLDDNVWLDNLGAADVAVVAVRENGGWLVSPTATLADAAAIAIDHFLSYNESDSLAEIAD